MKPSSVIRRAITSLMIPAAVVALASCGSDTTSSGAARLSILLKDAPGDVQQAVVTISQIYLQGSGGRIVLRSDPVTVDLLRLADTTATLVSDAEVPAGSYSQLRFVITGAYLAVENSQGGTDVFASSPDYEGLPSGTTPTGVLRMPSLAQSGLKVNLPGGSVAVNGGEKVLVVDFDVSQSFGHEAGASGQWVMHPVVKATDFALTGSLAVTLTAGQGITFPQVNNTTLTLGDFTAVITASDGTTSSKALTDDGSGNFGASFRYLAPGDYTVTFTAPTGVTFTTDPAVPAPATVSSDATTTAAFTLTGVSVAP